MSARAAAQLELLGFDQVYHYLRGKADWIVRGLRTQPRATLRERLDALPYFLNNLAPGLRSAWIRISRRITVAEFMCDDLPRITPEAPFRPTAAQDAPLAVVLNRDGVMLGAIEPPHGEPVEWRAMDAMNPAPQTVRPDMTPALAATLLRSSRYLLVTSADGRYIGRYHPPAENAVLSGAKLQGA